MHKLLLLSVIPNDSSNFQQSVLHTRGWSLSFVIINDYTRYIKPISSYEEQKLDTKTNQMKPEQYFASFDMILISC